MNQVDKEKWRRLVPALIIVAGGYAGYHWLSEAPTVTPTPSVAVTAPAKQPQTAALIELGKRVGATWVASQPQGWVTVAADEDGRTDRPCCEAHEIGRERLHRSRVRAGRGEEQVGKDQRGSRVVEEEVVPLDCRSDRARQRIAVAHRKTDFADDSGEYVR